MGALSDFLKQREPFATIRSDSQTGTTAARGRSGTPSDVRGCTEGGDSLESRDSQAVCGPGHGIEPDSPSNGRIDSHGFAMNRVDSQVGIEARRHVHGPSCDVLEREACAESRQSQDSQTHSGLRAVLMAIARAESIPRIVVDAIDHRDLRACTGLSDATLAAYLRALYRSRHMAEGRVPAGWTHVAHCMGCGPVWLPPTMPATVRACPWCHHRHAGRSVPAART